MPTYQEEREAQKKAERQRIRDAIETIRSGFWKTAWEFHDAIETIENALEPALKNEDGIDDTRKPEPMTTPLCGVTGGGYFLTNDFSRSLTPMNEPTHSILLDTLLSSLPKDWFWEPIPDGTFFYDSDYNQKTAMVPRNFSSQSNPSEPRIFKDFCCSIGVHVKHAGYIHTPKRMYLVMLSDAYPYVMFARQHDRTDAQIRESLSPGLTVSQIKSNFEACFLVFGLRTLDYTSRDPCFSTAATPADVIQHVNQSEVIPDCDYQLYRFWNPTINPAIRKVS